MFPFISAILAILIPFGGILFYLFHLETKFIPEPPLVENEVSNPGNAPQQTDPNPPNGNNNLGSEQDQDSLLLQKAYVGDTNGAWRVTT